MQGAPAQEVIPEEKGKRVAPTGADYSARCHCLTLTVARLGLASRLLSFASEPLSGRGVEASLLGRPTAMVHLRGFGGRRLPPNITMVFTTCRVCPLTTTPHVVVHTSKLRYLLGFLD